MPSSYKILDLTDDLLGRNKAKYPCPGFVHHKEATTQVYLKNTNLQSLYYGPIFSLTYSERFSSLLGIGYVIWSGFLASIYPRDILLNCLLVCIVVPHKNSVQLVTGHSHLQANIVKSLNQGLVPRNYCHNSFTPCCILSLVSDAKLPIDLSPIIVSLAILEWGFCRHLVFDRGVLYEGTGRHGESTLSSLSIPKREGFLRRWI